MRVDFTPEGDGGRRGERVVFWAWVAVIAGGLSCMIAVPVLGR